MGFDLQMPGRLDVDHAPRDDLDSEGAISKTRAQRTKELPKLTNYSFTDEESRRLLAIPVPKPSSKAEGRAGQRV